MKFGMILLIENEEDEEVIQELTDFANKRIKEIKAKEWVQN